MAIMIPSVINPNCSSQGEQIVFSLLKKDNNISDWIILHSLDIAEHKKQISGEIDFLIIIPNKGILCLEVKGSNKIKRENGMWYYGDETQPDNRGPFKQVSSSMHSLRKRLYEKRPDLGRILFWSAACFPLIEFSMTSEEWLDWQVIDNRALNSRPISTLINSIIDKARVHINTKKTTKWFDPNLNEPTQEQCKEILDIFRSDFEFFERPKSRNKRHNFELIKYTEEQYTALDAMNENSRVIFTGPAGTGKTLLAIESARRASTSDNSVLLVCYNRYLGNWLSEQLKGYNTRVKVGTLHSHMLSVAGVNVPSNVTREYWEEELPRLAIRRIINNSKDEYIFDKIILDEAQDIISNRNYLDFIDLSLSDGLNLGNWYFFGDFEKQAIYDNLGFGSNFLSEGIFGNFPKYTLRINCRNTPRIASVAYLLGGLKPNYKNILRPDDKVEPNLNYYKDKSEQYDLLTDTLQSLYDKGFSANDIIILSPKMDEDCAASSISASPWKQRLIPYRIYKKGYIGYCTIHAFKGMEKLIVIVTDIESISNDNDESLFYISVTRSTGQLHIFAQENIKTEVISKLTSI